MTASTLRVRRATVEDLDRLRSLWDSMHLPVAELEPRLTEFQIVESAEGEIVGAIGFQISASHGRLHSEGFTDFSLADTARDLLWIRIQTLSTNHGILRLWTQERTQFWIRLGFKAPDAEELKKLPALWNIEGVSWLTLQLKNEAALDAVEKELAMFKSAQKQQTARLTGQVRTWKTLATIVAVILALFAFGAAFFLLLKRPDLLQHGR
jgi:N-acetylglutamate synthase-like GNAT family acetyltransferase